jgi:hypothetical protein
LLAEFKGVVRIVVWHNLFDCLNKFQNVVIKPIDNYEDDANV